MAKMKIKLVEVPITDEHNSKAQVNKLNYNKLMMFDNITDKILNR